MDKFQALHNFWSSFGLKAYDENTVDDDAQMPYITYDISASSFDDVVFASGSIWYKSTSWEEISKKVDEISRAVNEHGYYLSKLDGGYIRIVSGSPFVQRMSDPSDDLIRRVYINISVEFITKY